MPLSAGERLGHYQILGMLGKGGMGEVYRARDTQLEREVAIKVLPAALAHDPERLARFEREAKVLAALNHPNIATIFGRENLAIVMELVEGPTLADRLKAGPLPLEETLAIAQQIVAALEAAHEKGVVHRDLKPANVKAPVDAPVKVLDFGLATAVQASAREPGDGGASPTLTMGATEAGVILGTASYMSPEQAAGKPVDKRADIWSFGVVLWEMLTGQRLFGAGESVAHILADVLRAPLDFGKVPAGPLRELLQRCLDRDVKTRLRDIGEARVAIQRYLAAPESGTESPAQAESLPHRRSVTWMAAAAAMTILAGVALWGWLKPRPAEPRPLIHFTTATPQGIFTNAIAVSRDGSRLAFVGATTRQIYMRTMDDPVAKLVPGTETGLFPVFSPDGQWLAFIAGAAAPYQLKKVPIAGGAALTLTAGLTFTSPMTWGEDGNILLGGAAIQRIAEAGGQPVVIAKAETAKAEFALYTPQLLPGGKHILASVLTPKGVSEFRAIAVAVETGEKKVLLESAGETRFAPTGAEPGVGHLLYARNGSLFAAAFNAATLQVGPAAPVLEGLRNLAGLNHAGFSYSGTLAYPGGGNASLGNLSSLIWVDRQGAEQPLTAPSRNYVSPRISPDGGRVALQVIDLSPTVDIQVWVHDLARGTTTRLTFERANGSPVWTPDGKRLIYASGSSIGNSSGTLAAVAADGSGQPVTLIGEGLGPSPTSVSPDGKLVMGVRSNFFALSGSNLWVLPLGGGEAKPEPFLDTRFVRGNLQFSPDGKWVAFESNETGRNEIYVVPYPGPGGKSQVSSEGGTQPRWNRNGRELFFRSGDKMMAVDVETGAAFRAGSPHMLFEKVSADYDVAPDGRRFLMLKPSTAAADTSELHVILNWFDDLRRRVPLK